MNQQIGADLDTAYNMLTPSVYNFHNKQITSKIKKEEPKKENSKQNKSCLELIWYFITWPFSCCSLTKNNITKDEKVVDNIIINNSMNENNNVVINNEQKWVDTGLNKIPLNEFDKRLNSLILQREQQDKEFLSNLQNKEHAQNNFQEFNKKRNEEINEQFKQMQKDKCY